MPLPYSAPDHLAAHQFLVEEAHLLDPHQYEAWLALMAEDVSYVMPARVSGAKAAGEEGLQTIDHFAENRYSLRKRVERFATKYAWTEDPPSRLRHHVSNVRTFAGAADDELLVESAVLL